jgi:hypothetical protein
MGKHLPWLLAFTAAAIALIVVSRELPVRPGKPHRWSFLIEVPAAKEKWYLDTATVVYFRRVGDLEYVTAWVKIEKPAGDYQIERYNLTNQRRILRVSWAHYTPAGVPTGSGNNGAPNEWTDIFPQSIGEKLYDRLFK